MSKVKVNYNNKEYEYEKDTLLSDIAKDFKNDFEYDILVASINNRVTSLNNKLTRNCKLRFFDITKFQGNVAYERGVLFLFSKAVRDVLNCDIKVHYTLDNGIYCEILTNNLISEVTVEKIKIEMRHLVERALPITKIMVSRLDAIDYYTKINQMDKASSLRYISNSSVSLYKLDDMLDYFYGVLPNNTSYLKEFNVKFLKDNKVIIMIPYLFDIKRELKYAKNDKLLNVMEENDKYLTSMDIRTSVELNKIISTG